LSVAVRKSPCSGHEPVRFNGMLKSLLRWARAEGLLAGQGDRMRDEPRAWFRNYVAHPSYHLYDPGHAEWASPVPLPDAGGSPDSGGSLPQPSKLVRSVEMTEAESHAPQRLPGVPTKAFHSAAGRAQTRIHSP
jgi:hypothetical protein